jgi:MFS family permease
MSVTHEAANEWRQHWTVLLPCVAGIMLCALNGYSLGVMFGPLQQAFGWTRAQISAGPLILSMIAIFTAPLVGVAVDRFGPRRIAVIGVVLFCSASGLFSTAIASIWSWWGLWLISSISSMFVLPMIWTTAINGFFNKNRGMALAIALCGTSLTATTVPMLTNYLVDAHGWRMAYVWLAAIAFAFVFPLVWFLFRSVADNRRTRDASTGSQTIAPVLTGVSAREGFRSARFLKMAGAIGIFSAASCALTTNAVPIIIAQGIDRSTAAALAGLVGIGSLMGRLGGGYFLDRFDANKVAAVSVLTPIISVALLLGLPGSTTGTMIASLALGLSVGTELDACAYLAARHFGLRSFGTLFGAINGLLLFANGFMPFAANYAYDVMGNYHLILWVEIPACLISALLFLRLGSYPDFTQEPASVAM